MSIVSEIPGWFTKTKVGQEEVAQIKTAEEITERTALAEVNHVLRQYLNALPAIQLAEAEAEKKLEKAEAQLTKAKEALRAAKAAATQANAQQEAGVKRAWNTLPRSYRARIEQFMRKCETEKARLNVSPVKDHRPTGRRVELFSDLPTRRARWTAVHESWSTANALLAPPTSPMREDVDAYLADLETDWPPLKLESVGMLN